MVTPEPPPIKKPVPFVLALTNVASPPGSKNLIPAWAEVALPKKTIPATKKRRRNFIEFGLLKNFFIIFVLLLCTVMLDIVFWFAILPIQMASARPLMET